MGLLDESLGGCFYNGEFGFAWSHQFKVYKAIKKQTKTKVRLLMHVMVFFYSFTT